jgi:hypothetical protein
LLICSFWLLLVPERISIDVQYNPTPLAMTYAGLHRSALLLAILAEIIFSTDFELFEQHEGGIAVFNRIGNAVIRAGHIHRLSEIAVHGEWTTGPLSGGNVGQVRLGNNRIGSGYISGGGIAAVLQN